MNLLVKQIKTVSMQGEVKFEKSLFWKYFKFAEQIIYECVHLNSCRTLKKRNPTSFFVSICEKQAIVCNINSQYFCITKNFVVFWTQQPLEYKAYMETIISQRGKKKRPLGLLKAQLLHSLPCDLSVVINPQAKHTEILSLPFLLSFFVLFPSLGRGLRDCAVMPSLF